MAIIIDNTWCGIKDMAEDVRQSITTYGFAHSFRPVDENGKIYTCIIPDNEEWRYILCELNIEDVKDIVSEHPEIPCPDVDKETIGNMLYLIDLYCDLYDEIDFSDSEHIQFGDITFKDPNKGTLEERVIIRKKTFLKMSKETIERVLAIVDEKRLTRFEVKKAGYVYTRGENLARNSEINDAIFQCNDILRSYGMKLPEFMSRVKRANGKIYWKTKTKFNEIT